MDNYPQPVMKRQGFYSIIWLIPLIAAMIGGILIYDYYQKLGLPITIVFADGQGLEDNKTRIRYEGINIGRVEKIELVRGEKKVKVTARLDKSAAYLAREGTLFWVVKPELSPGRISGLETIISGRYIALRPGKSVNEPRNSFVGLDEPLAGDLSLPGLHLVLKAARLGSLNPGTPVLHRQIEVGRVDGHQLSSDNLGVDVQIYILPQFSDLVRTTSRFWNAGGITVTGGIAGIKVHSESITTLIAGGVAFDTPENDYGEAAGNLAVYSLFGDKESAASGLLTHEEERFNPGLLVQVHFKNAEGIQLGKSLVKFKGITIGKVVDHTVSDDLAGVILTIMLRSEAVSAACDGAQYWIVKPRLGSGGLTGLSTILGGRYIEIRPGTGARQTEFVGLDAPPLTALENGGVNIVLTCDNPGSLSPGSPLYYRRLEVGKVTGLALADDGSKVRIHAQIFKEYSHLVKKNTRFWNASGISVKATLAGLQVRTTSLESLLSGGIDFETPAGARSVAAEDGQEFELFVNEEKARAWGRVIRIVFDELFNLEKEAALKYKGVKIGEVEQIALKRTMDGVEVMVRLNPAHENIARQGSKFWLVTPKIGLNGVANLGNIIRGNFLAVLPGDDGPIVDEFLGLRGPPPGVINRDLRLTLTTLSLGGLEVGSPVLMRHVAVGQVEDYQLAPDGQQVLIEIVIHQPFMQFVGTASNFHRIPGIQVEASLSGFAVQMDSMASLLAGGIALENLGEGPGEPIAAGHGFVLYEDMQEIIDRKIAYQEFFLAARQLGSLGPGKPVYYRGVKVGKILGVELSDTASRVMIRAGIEDRYAALVRIGSKFWNVSGIGVDFSLFSGTKVRTQSVEAILAGGLGFATPEEGGSVPEDFIFQLHDTPEEEWLEWQPEFALKHEQKGVK